jgi:hypothetical protein
MTVRFVVDKEALISQSLQFQEKVSLVIIGWYHKLGFAQCHMYVKHCVSDVRAVEMPVLACLNSSCSEVPEVGRLQVL